MNETNLDARLETLEFKLAHLERALQELSDVVVRQQREIDRLALRSAELATQLASTDGAGTDPSIFEVPPHY